MKLDVRLLFAVASIGIASLAWCADSYFIRVRNNSSSTVSLEVKSVGPQAACDGAGDSATYSIGPGEAQQLVCSSSNGDMGFCLRDSASADWKRLDCTDRPLQDVIELDLFGR
jgi:hypothetical protein